MIRWLRWWARRTPSVQVTITTHVAGPLDVHLAAGDTLHIEDGTRRRVVSLKLSHKARRLQVHVATDRARVSHG